MGDALDESDDEEPEFESPRKGERLELGADSYNDEDLMANAAGASAAASVDPYRLEDNREQWHPALESEIAATAAVLSEKMVSHPEDAGRGIAQPDEDLAQFADPLGLGVLNQATMQLEATDEAAGGTNTRRQLQKLARYQAGATMQLQDSGGDGVASVRSCFCNDGLLITLHCRCRCEVAVHTATVMRQAPPSTPERYLFSFIVSRAAADTTKPTPTLLNDGHRSVAPLPGSEACFVCCSCTSPGMV